MFHIERKNKIPQNNLHKMFIVVHLIGFCTDTCVIYQACFQKSKIWSLFCDSRNVTKKDVTKTTSSTWRRVFADASNLWLNVYFNLIFDWCCNIVLQCIFLVACVAVIVNIVVCCDSTERRTCIWTCIFCDLPGGFQTSLLLIGQVWKYESVVQNTKHQEHVEERWFSLRKIRNGFVLLILGRQMRVCRRYHS